MLLLVLSILCVYFYDNDSLENCDCIFGSLNDSIMICLS